MSSNHMDKSFNCKYCAKSFKRKDYLKRHISKNMTIRMFFQEFGIVLVLSAHQIYNRIITVQLTNQQNMIL